VVAVWSCAGNQAGRDQQEAVVPIDVIGTETSGTPTISSGTSSGRSVGARRLGLAGAAWAVSYLPIHLYWALGGTSSAIGLPHVTASFAAANVAACVVIAGAGATCLSLVQPWGRALPYALRHAVAWIGAVVGAGHALVFGVQAALRLSGVLSYPPATGLTTAQLHGFDIANLAYFEPWFLVMGVLLAACSLAGRRTEHSRRQRMSLMSSLSAGLLAGGVLAAVVGTMAFRPVLYAVVGPVLLLAGAAMLVSTVRRGAQS